MNIQEVVCKGILPEDELNTAERKILLLFILGFAAVFFGAAYLFHWGPQAEPLQFRLYFFIFFITLLLYTLYSFSTENRLSKIATGLSDSENLRLADLTAQRQGWVLEEKKGHFLRVYHKSSWGWNQGYKLVVAADDGAIYYNLRNKGSSKGRLPYSFGLNTFYRKKLLHSISQSLQLPRVQAANLHQL